MIHELLSIGRENAITVKSISDTLNISIANVRRQAQKERNEGIPICINFSRKNGGYYLPRDESDIDDTILFLSHPMHQPGTRQALVNAKKDLESLLHDTES
jgi:biotin operon repressor